MTADELILPSQIPWGEIKGKDLEELLYWLLDSMGAKDLEWRIGGSGDGSSDQGRDLECRFFQATPDGDLTGQRWWVESKGRSRTVEPTEVKSAVLNAAGKKYIDVLVVATNSNFSNPTRDWVKEWQRDNPRPVVRLWEKTELERYSSKFPIAVIRLFSKALSPQGRIEVVRSRFWNYSHLSDAPTLDLLWKARANLRISPEALLSIIVSEAANGDFGVRPWAVHVPEELLLTAFATALINFYFLIFRATDSGTRHEPYIKALSYLTLCCIDRIGGSRTAELLKNWNNFDEREWPEEVKKLILQPVLGLLTAEIRDVCADDCTRIHSDRIELTKDEIKHYWARLKVNPDGPKKEDDRVLMMEAFDKPCKVGFCVDKEKRCPIANLEHPETKIDETIHIIERIEKFRKTGSDDDPSQG